MIDYEKSVEDVGIFTSALLWQWGSSVYSEGVVAIGWSAVKEYLLEPAMNEFLFGTGNG